MKASSLRIAINAHYLYRSRLSGLARYAREIINALPSETFVEIRPPKFFYRKNSKAWRYLRFGVLAVYECLLPPVLLVLRRAELHISPAFAVPLCWWSSRCVVVVHDLAFREFSSGYSRPEQLYLWFNLRLLRAGKYRIVTPSAYVKQSVCDFLRISDTRVTVISPYSDLPKPRGAVLMDIPEKYFLLLSNAHPRKNIDATVAGFHASSAPMAGYKLLVAGNFERRVNISSPHVLVRPGVSDEELASLFVGAEALLLFSLSEGFGFPVVEAAQFDIVSLTSEVSSLRELISPHRTPQPALTAVEITAAIDKYLADATFRTKLKGDAAYVKSMFTKDKFDRQWQELVLGDQHFL